MRILGQDWSLEYIGNGNPAILNRLGECDTWHSVARIARGLSPAEEESTILHEVLEALKYKLQLKLSHAQLMSLESGLFAALRDNGITLAPLVRELHASERKVKKR